MKFRDTAGQSGPWSFGSELVGQAAFHSSACSSSPLGCDPKDGLHGDWAKAEECGVSLSLGRLLSKGPGEAGSMPGGASVKPGPGAGGQAETG